MAKYNYDELRSAAMSGRRIGGWKGKNVYACSKYDYDASEKDYYVLYDDGNKMIGQGYCVGSISETGLVDEIKNRYWYNVPQRKNDKVTKRTSASGYSAEVITDDFFRKLDQEINALLENVAELKFDQGDLNI